MAENDSSEFNSKTRQQIEINKVAFDNLRASVNNLNKPLLAISNSINSLDRDLSKLTDTITKLNTQNDVLAASGGKLKTNLTDISSSFSTWSGIVTLATKTLGGWGAALSAGLTFVTVYGDGILKWANDLMKGTTTLTALGQAMKNNNIIANSLIQTKLQGAQAAQREITDLNLLYKATQSHTLSLSQKKDAIKVLRDEWPDTFKNINDETILSGNAATAYKNLKDQILAAAFAEAAKNKITNNTERILENEQKIAEERAKNLKIILAQDKAGEEMSKGSRKVTDSVSDRIRKNNDQYDFVIKRQTDAYNKQTKLREASDKYIYDLTTDTKLLNKENDFYNENIEKRIKLFGIGVAGHSLNKNHLSGKKSPQPNPNTTELPDKSRQLIDGHAIDFAQTIELEKKKYDAELTSLNGMLSEKLISQEQYEEQSKKLKEKYHQNIGGSIKEFADSGLDKAYEALQNYYVQNKKREEKEAEEHKQRVLERKEFELQAAQQVSNAAFSILQNDIKSQSQTRLKQLDIQKQAELSNTSLTSSQKQAIEAKYQKKEAEEKTKAFKAEQRASILQAVINGALAVTKVTAQTGVLSAFAIPAIIAETAIQVATIAAQKTPQYAKGGLHYQSDGKGALLSGYSRTDNTNAYLRSGEAVVVSEAMRNPWARNLVSAINVAHGGRDFSITNPGRGYAIGGIFTDGGNSNRYYNQPMNDQKDLANTIAYQMINNFPPVYVDVKDINNQQNILAQTVNRVNL
ncbi:hypothetical protein [Mucilaginibacter sp. UR6-11]|uniref:hypothetical protein n=1 Tax=Mucilaginibacter sp. UR6-11 TaxID=1435644 RepID=UPI001E341ABC|nr:hypothetical protein [Mucilaginibacter sp. UR6-11]MCC8427222.1 hypothetical protein [Mucilaginibacter sp. UR6-11]